MSDQLPVIDNTQPDNMVRECTCGAALDFPARNWIGVQCDNCGAYYDPYGRPQRPEPDPHD